MTIFNEKQGCVLFPNMKGEPDLNIMFYGEDKEFLEWCFDCLNTSGKGGQFDENKLKSESSRIYIFIYQTSSTMHAKSFCSYECRTWK